MTDAQLLANVKAMMGETSTYHDTQFMAYIVEVKEYLSDAGVSATVLASDAIVGIVQRGVVDLWNNGAGGADLSPYFKQRAIQLALKGEPSAKPSKVTKVFPYLYTAEYRFLDYDAGAAYFERFRPTIGACSTVSKGIFFGRNYDWTYDERCSFVVRTTAENGRHASIGVAFAPSELTQAFIESEQSSDLYKVVPFCLLDGINDAGLICEINVVPTGDKGLTFGTNPEGEDLFAMMIPRYVLDNASSVDKAITLLESRNVFCANSSEMKQEFHFMLSDGTKTAVVEFVNNEMVVIESFVDDKAIMTNFYLDGYDGTRESLTAYAMGIERQAILTDGYSAVNSENAMVDLMQSVRYTKTYSLSENPLWCSEFAGNWNKWGDLTKDTPTEDYLPIMQHYASEFEHRKRNGATWQTVHTSVYNISDKKLIVIPQETGQRFVFRLNGGGSSG